MHEQVLADFRNGDGGGKEGINAGRVVVDILQDYYQLERRILIMLSILSLNEDI